GVDLEDLNASVDHGVVHPSVVDSCEGKDGPEKRLVGVRGDVLRGSRQKLSVRELRHRRLDHPVPAEEEIAGGNSSADGVGTVAMVEAAGVRDLPVLDDQLVVAVCSARNERLDGRLQLIGRAEQSGEAAEVLCFAADEHREAERAAISEAAHVEIVDATFL